MIHVSGRLAPRLSPTPCPRLLNQAAREAAELPADADAPPSAMEEAVRDLERAQWPPPPEPSEQQVRSYYEARRAEFGIPAGVRMRAGAVPSSSANGPAR